METKQAAPGAAPAAPPASGSSLRLVILLGVLVLVVGALGYDQFVLKPASKAAYDKIQRLVDERNKEGVKTGSLVTSADVQKELGRAPTWKVENDKEGYEIEYYCFWGKMPLLNRRRHFIAVVYTGNKPRHFSSHYQEEPPLEALPITPTPSEDKGETVSAPPTAATSGGEPAPNEKAPTEKAPEEKESPAKAPESAEKPAAEKSADKESPAEGKN